LFEDGTVIDEAIQCAALAAHREYARAGLSMPVWSGERIEWIAPGELETAEPSDLTTR